MDNQAWSWVLGLVGVGGFILAGKKIWWAWYINIAAQFIWAAYAIITDQLGFLVSAGVYTVVFVKNAISWTKEHREKKNALVQYAVDDVKQSENVLKPRSPQVYKTSSIDIATVHDPVSGKDVQIHNTHNWHFDQGDYALYCQNCKTVFTPGSTDAIKQCSSVVPKPLVRYFTPNPDMEFTPNSHPGIFFEARSTGTVDPEETACAWKEQLDQGDAVVAMPAGSSIAYLNEIERHYVHQSHILLVSDAIGVSCINCNAEKVAELEKPCAKVEAYVDDIRMINSVPPKELGLVDPEEFYARGPIDETHSIECLQGEHTIFWCVRCGIDTRESEYALEDRCKGGALTHHYKMHRNPENNAIEKWREAYE